MRGTYFSESALLPEHGSTGYSTDDARFAVELSHNFSRLPRDDVRRRLNWIRSQLHLADPGRIKTYEQPISVAQMHTQQKRVPSGRNHTNIFAVLEPRVGAMRSEAIVVVAKHRLHSSSTQGTQDPLGSDEVREMPGGVAVVLSLVKYLAKQKYLSKRLVFVFCDGGSETEGWDGGMDLGVREWIRAYVGGEIVTAGQIRAAILLDIRRGEDISELGLAMHGNNGLLSNLDLVNVLTMSRSQTRTRNARIVAVSRLRRRDHPLRARVAAVKSWIESIWPAPLSMLLERHRGKQPRYFDTVEGTFSFMADVAFGPTRGGHTHFLDRGIDAVTVTTRPQSRPAKATMRKSVSATLGLGNHLEVAVRSMSSLSETLHQSFWQYILPHPHFMVTVEEYGFVLLVMTLCVPLQMYKMLMNPGSDAFGVQLTARAQRVFWIGAAVSTSALFTMYWLNSDHGGRLQEPFRNTAEIWIICTLCIYAAGLSAMILFASGSGNLEDTELRAEKHSHSWRGMKFLVLVPFYAVHCFLIGILNYPFAYFANTIMIPVVCGAFPRAAWPRSICGVLMRIAHGFLLLATSPPAIIFLWVPTVSSLVEGNEVLLFSGREGTEKNSPSLVGTPSEVTEVWARVYRNWSEMGTFHALYFSGLYVPLHAVSAYITFSAS